MKSLLTRDNSRLKLEVLVRSSEISPSLVRIILSSSDDGWQDGFKEGAQRYSVALETCNIISPSTNA